MKYYKVLQSVTKYYKVLKGFTKFYKVNNDKDKDKDNLSILSTLSTLSSITKYYRDKSSASTRTNFLACLFLKYSLYLVTKI